jgi:GTP-binding protein HflX
MEQQMQVVTDLIRDFGWEKKPTLYVFNKIDMAGPEKMFRVQSFPRVFVSASTGEGLTQLKSLLAEIIKSTVREVEMFFPHQEEHKIYELAKDTHIMKQEKASQGTILFAYLTANLMAKWRDYLVNPPQNLSPDDPSQNN